MNTIDLADVSALAPYVKSSAGEPLILKENGHTVAAIIPADDADVESLLLSINPQFQRILHRSQQRLEAEGPLSTSEVREALGITTSEAIGHTGGDEPASR